MEGFTHYTLFSSVSHLSDLLDDPHLMDIYTGVHLNSDFYRHQSVLLCSYICLHTTGPPAISAVPISASVLYAVSPGSIERALVATLHCQQVVGQSHVYLPNQSQTHFNLRCLSSHPISRHSYYSSNIFSSLLSPLPSFHLQRSVVPYSEMKMIPFNLELPFFYLMLCFVAIIMFTASLTHIQPSFAVFYQILFFVII